METRYQPPPAKAPKLTWGEEQEKLIRMLEQRIEAHDNNRKAVLDKLQGICERLREQIDELEDKITKELDEEFNTEDNRLQTALNELRGNNTASALKKAKAELIITQLYDISECNVAGCGSKLDLKSAYELETDRHLSLKMVEMRKPTNVRVSYVNKKQSVTFTYLNPDEERIFSDNAIVNSVKYKCMLFKKGNEQKSKVYSLHKKKSDPSFFTFTPDILEAGTTYGIRAKVIVDDRGSEWSDATEFVTTMFSGCIWKKCPGYADEDRKYSVNKKNPRIATKINNDSYCTIIGNTHIPPDTVTSWSIKVHKSKDNNGRGICIGITTSNIIQDDNYNNLWWYFRCYSSKLRSGPPHNYRGKEYGPRKWDGQYVHTGDSVGVVVDTTNGELSFVLNNVNLGVAYEGIPLDKPLVPCVFLLYQGDSVELDTSEVEENVDSSISVPSNITTKSSTWDSITLTWNTITFTWNEVVDASFYQIEVDGSISCDASTTNSFTKMGLLPETEHCFRVRTARRSSVSEWSGVVKGRTLKESFETSWWKACPGDVDWDRKYGVDERNTRVAAKVGDSYCTIIGNTHIPPNTVTSWNIKVLKSKYNNGDGIYIGIAPNDIDQNDVNYRKCGWYFNCYDSILWSGLPHYYRYKEYGPSKKDGEYVHTGGSVGLVVDTTKGELSFVLNGVNLGVAYEGIPLDKPLVPCVILEYEFDFVELDTSEVKENADSSVPVPPNITTKSSTWDSITLTWDKVSGASFYQVEVDGSKLWGSSTTNSFTKRRLLPDTEYSFRVRAVRGNSVSEWSDVVKGRTLKFSDSVWKECPDGIDKKKKYSIDKENPRIATKNNDGSWLFNDDYCTIIGNMFIPSNMVTSWHIKVLKSKKNGSGICIGIAPNDIDQNNGVNYNKCGWYFSCYHSSLYSGPPHNYSWGKEYGPRKGDGQYVHTGDSIDVVMDTAKGELSFVLDGVDCGVAFEGIPLDKPLVPCVLLWYEGDSVELANVP